MCGFTGFWQTPDKNEDELNAQVRQMALTLEHRGPDDSAEFVDQTVGLAFGFRRLAIVDLSPGGRQPMTSASGRYVIIFNGEVYNYQSLRTQLESLGHRFHSQSDTEVMLAAIEQWSVQQAVSRFNGQFAIALWDRQERQLTLARDRLGINPLYYGKMGDTLLFGSELKALRAHPAFIAEINRDALTLFMRHNYIPAPYTIYQGVKKLPPGCTLTFNHSNQATPTPQPYWSFRQIALQGLQNPFVGTETEATDLLESALMRAVRLRMIADVPLGAFLSGGIDSSTVVALMQAQSDQPIRTFSIGFEAEGYNEAPHAKAVADHLGTQHTEMYVTEQEALDMVPQLPFFYDEPFSDASQIPTLLVSKMARRHVTVSLSGDGGDELFAGYRRYYNVRQKWAKFAWLPPKLRMAVAGRIGNIPVSTYDRWLGRFAPPPAKNGTSNTMGAKAHTVAMIMASQNGAAFYRNAISHWKNPATLVIGGREPQTPFNNPSTHLGTDFVQEMMFSDSITYLPDDILTKMDRASMAVSLEARVPLLDHHVVELAWRLPLSLKYKDGVQKSILKQVLYRHVPQTLIDRPKMGFGVPMKRWLRGALRDWGEALISPTRLAQEGYLNSKLVSKIWQQHQSGERDGAGRLWDVLMFQAWLEHTTQSTLEKVSS